MGLFKSMKDMAEMTKSGNELRKKQQQESGYKAGLGGTMDQMGDMMSQANDQLKDLAGQSGEREKILTEGDKGTGTILSMGTPERGAAWFNLKLDLEVKVRGRKAYKIKQQYMVPAAAELAPGVELPIAVDKEDPKRIAIDWQGASTGPKDGEIRPA